MAEFEATDKLTLDREIDRVAHAFEQQLRRGEAPRIDEVFARHAALGAALREELLAVELEHKLCAGATLDWPAYQARFPEDAVFLDHLRQEFRDRFAPALSDTPSDGHRGWATETTIPYLPPTPPPLAPLNLDDYALERRLGKGGQGEVHLARQQSLDRLVAVKLLLKSAEEEGPNVQRFLREARTLAQTHHPHIVTIHGLGRLAEGGYFLVMEYIAGDDLARQIRQRTFAPNDAARIVVQIAGAIEHAHQRGVIHRDLKPSNVLWDEVRGPVVTDFGLAKDLRAADDLTISEQMLGTPAFMAPEQAHRRFGEISPRTDVYGLGATLFALLTGQGPYASGSIGEILQQLASDGPLPDPRGVKPDTPAPLADICRRALARHPAERYDSASALAEDLDRWLTGQPLAAVPAKNALTPATEMFGPYRLIESLTQDSTRCVYRAVAPDGRSVLLKILPGPWRGDRLKRSQFRQEVLLSSKLKHACLAPVIEVGTVDQAEFIALEYIDGESLAQVLAREGRLDIARAIQIMYPIAVVLHQIHQAGVFYGNLRPQNVLLTPAGNPMLAEVRFSQELDQNDNVTLMGAGPVTALYIAPELILGGTSNVLSEVYALGATLYALITGLAPFAEAADVLTVMISKNEGRYADPRQHAPEVSDALVQLLAAALHPLPAQRPTSAAEFGQRLEQALFQTPSPRKPTPQPTPEGSNLVHAMWDQMDADLQDAFALAYNKKRRTGSTRISTQDLFQALARLGRGDVRRLLDALPPGAMPDPADAAIPTDRAVLREQPLLSDCVQESLTEFRKMPARPSKLAPTDLFVDVAKHGHGASVVRLREHGVDPDAVERIVQQLGLKVLRRPSEHAPPRSTASETISDGSAGSFGWWRSLRRALRID